MVQDYICPLSGHDSQVTGLLNTIGRRISCPACGTYELDDLTNLGLGYDESSAKGREYILSGLARRASDEGRPITISTENIDVLLGSMVPPRDPQELLDRLILYLGAKATTFVAQVVVNLEDDYPIAFARNAKELAYCILMGEDSGLFNSIGTDTGTLKAGAPADVTIFDPDAEWTVDSSSFASKGKNTPLDGATLKGKVVATIVGGEVVYEAP